MSISILIRVLILFVFLLLVDFYAYQAVKTAFRGSTIARIIYWSITAGMICYLAYIVLNFNRNAGPTGVFSNFMALTILLTVPKLIMIIFMLGEDVFRFLEGTITSIAGKEDKTTFLASRRKFISQSAMVIAAIPFASILYGVWRGKYNYRVIRQTLSFKDLPEEFDGLTITQISDIHSGSFDNANKIQYGIDLINEQKSDLILFTGDMVNNRSSEMEPWISHFSQLKAPMGKFSILGNHDYGDYIDWPDQSAKKRNMERLFEIHEELGFKLLKNENVQLKKGGASIDLIGVENWGAGGFAKHGDLEKAMTGIAPEAFKILMSHDPSHFDAMVKNFKDLIHLTLSGHTHGMQFGIEIPGWIKWSPIKYRYPKWAGLYEEAGRLLYVNRGFGFLAFPGRVGIWPEITVLELKKA